MPKNVENKIKAKSPFINKITLTAANDSDPKSTPYLIFFEHVTQTHGLCEIQRYIIKILVKIIRAVFQIKLACPAVTQKWPENRNLSKMLPTQWYFKITLLSNFVDHVMRTNRRLALKDDKVQNLLKIVRTAFKIQFTYKHFQYFCL